jgi:hypothetical protein
MCDGAFVFACRTDDDTISVERIGDGDGTVENEMGILGEQRAIFVRSRFALHGIHDNVSRTRSLGPQ